jgi:hypothetical protein
MSREMIDVMKKLREMGYYDEPKKEKVDETITITADSPDDLPALTQIMKLAGLQKVTPDMMPDQDAPMMTMKGDSDINGNHEDEDAEEGYANEPKEKYKAYDKDEYQLQRVRGRDRKFSMRGDNPLEDVEEQIRQDYVNFVNEDQKKRLK